MSWASVLSQALPSASPLKKLFLCINKGVHLAAKPLRPEFLGPPSFQIAGPVAKPCQARVQVTSPDLGSDGPGC